MKKIYKLKSWYSLDDAAQRLALTLGEDITVGDMIQLAIEGHIRLSWYMRHVTAEEVEHCGRAFPFNTVNQESATIIIEDGFLSLEKESVDVLHGAYYLLLEHNSALSDHLLAEINGKESDLLGLDGFCVQNGEGRVWRIVERHLDWFIKHRGYDKIDNEYHKDKYYPSTCLPDIKELGFQKADLENFENSLQEQDSENKNPKPLHTREKETLLKIIICMAVEQYGFAPQAKRSDVAKRIADDIQSYGLSLDEDTVRKKLQEATELFPQEIEEISG